MLNDNENPNPDEISNEFILCFTDKQQEDDLKAIQLASSEYLNQIFEGIKDVVNNQDKIIGHASGITKKAEACKSLLINIVTKNSRQLDNEIQGISIEKLTSKNPTMLSMFKSLEGGRTNAA